MRWTAAGRQAAWPARGVLVTDDAGDPDSAVRDDVVGVIAVRDVRYRRELAV